MPAALTASPQKRQQVLDRLESPIKTRDDLLRLFVNTLGYQRVERPIPITKDTFGEGIALDLAQKHRPIRLVEKYEQRAQVPSRTDDEVWRAYRKELETKQILARLQPKRIVAKDYDHEFEHAWKNGVWSLFQPVSLDLQDADTILDKANRWLGRATNLKDSDDKFRLWMLIGEPRIEKLKPAYAKARNILNKMPVQKDFVNQAEGQG